MGLERWGTNSGHGHVWARPDGAKVRCGGPGLCSTCAADQSLIQVLPPGEAAAPDPAPLWEQKVNPVHCQPGKRVDPKPSLGD